MAESERFVEKEKMDMLDQQMNDEKVVKEEQDQIIKRHFKDIYQT